MEEVEEDWTTERVNERRGVRDDGARDEHPRDQSGGDHESVFEWYFHVKLQKRHKKADTKKKISPRRA